MAKCETCGLDLTKFGPRHRCLSGKIEGARKPTQLEAERIAKGQLDPAALLPKDRLNSQPLGRLARRTPTDNPIADQTAGAPSRESQPTMGDIMKAIAGLQASFDRLQAAILDKRESV